MAKKTFVMIVVGLLASGLFGCGILQDDVGFARTVLNLLANNRYVVRPMIDWRSLYAINYDVGKDYLALKSEAERAEYERVFISNFARGFKAGGASLAGFYHWRIHKADNPKMVIVAVDYKGNKNVAYFFAIKHEGWNKKLAGIEMRVWSQK